MLTLNPKEPEETCLGLTSEQFVAARDRTGQSGVEALAAYRRVMRGGTGDAGSATGPIVRAERDDHAVKFLQRLPDGLICESVLIDGSGAGGEARASLCVSSQVGCELGCTFCETARMGLRRNLTAAEIVGQWFAARFELGVAVRNVVFMGMGEPMENLDEVIQAIRVLADRNGPGIAPSRITVSTVGRADGIRRLARFAARPGWRQLRLAVSVNAPDDDVRRSIMPIARVEPLAPLMDAMLEWSRPSRRRVLVEYVLIPGVNDQPGHAERLCDFLRPLPSTVNVIAYNPRRGSSWPAPEAEQVDAFAARVAAAGQPVRRRRTRGRSVWGACGLLGEKA